MLSVIIPTHNPHPERLRRTLAGLRAQNLADSVWECVVVDNASAPALSMNFDAAVTPRNCRLVQAPQLGLTYARQAGFDAAAGDLFVLVDDDNVLAPDYLTRVVEIFARHSQLGAAGGRSWPEFEQPPAPWVREFDNLLACRDLGDREMIASVDPEQREHRLTYPACSPIGAGMALRRAAVQAWLARPDASLPDRRGDALTSGGDNDIVLTILRHGWQVGYFPSLNLTHLIPASRIQADYLARLNRGIAKSWIQVLAKHEACPWRPIAPSTVRLRQLKAWFVHRAWRSPAARVRWQGACGHFEGLATLSNR